jgi:hypothetical protein
MRRTPSETVTIRDFDPWIKVVGMLQHNWATIEPFDSAVRVYFISDTSWVFDEMLFADVNEAQFALLRNGFLLQRAETGRWRTLRPPQPPFMKGRHPNGRIYSSGRSWR